MATVPGSGRWRIFAASVVGGGICTALAIAAAAGAPAPAEHSIRITASQYAFHPAVIRVRRGDTLRLRFASTDVVHGFYLEGHGINVTIPPLAGEVTVQRPAGSEVVQEVVFVASRSGKFRFRCSQTCGAMHPFMTGELVVGPNWLFGASVAAAIAMLVGGLGLAWWGPQRRTP